MTRSLMRRKRSMKIPEGKGWFVKLSIADESVLCGSDGQSRLMTNSAKGCKACVIFPLTPE